MTDYIQAGKIIDFIFDAVSALKLPWKLIRVDGSDRTPYREAMEYRRERLREIFKSGLNAVAVEVGFSCIGQIPPKKKEPESQNGTKEKFPQSPWGSGIKTSHKIGCGRSEALARAVHSEMVKVIPLPDRGIKAPQQDEIFNGCKIPIILVRPLFLDSRIDPWFIRFSRGRMFVAAAIVSGVQKYLAETERAERANSKVQQETQRPLTHKIPLGGIEIRNGAICQTGAP